MEPLSFGFKTDQGRTRKANQDSCAVLSSSDLRGLADGLFIVADGMGGRAGGEIASRVTVETVPKVVREVLDEEKNLNSGERMQIALQEALGAANEAVFGQAKANPELRGMGTTCVAVLVHDGIAAVGNIGDSRVYLLREGQIRPLTHDHSLVAQHLLAGQLTEEEARSSRYRNIITRAIGIGETVEPDVDLIRLQAGDTLLLCSDGLTNMLTEPEIARILAQGDDPDTTCEYLIGGANAAGGLDNISAIVLRYGRFVPVEIVEEDEPEPDEYARPVPYPAPKRRSFWRTLQIPVLFAIVAVAWFMLSGYELQSGPPYLVKRKIPGSTSPITAPKIPIDYSSLKYAAEPKTILNRPVRGSFLDVAPSGEVTVVESGNNELVTMKNGKASETGILVTIDDSTNGPGLARDPSGLIYVVSRPDKAIYKYDPAQKMRIETICKGRLVDPEAIGIDVAGHIYVIDGKRLKKIAASRATSDRGVSDAAR